MAIIQRIELHKTGEACQAAPDCVDLPFSDELIAQIAAGRAMLSLGLLGHVPEIVLSLPDDGRFFVDEFVKHVEYVCEEGAGDFEVSSGWLHVEERGIQSVRYWEDNSEDELLGQIDLAEASELRDAIEAAMPAAFRALREALKQRVL